MGRVISQHVEVEVDLDEFDDDEIREEAEARGLLGKPNEGEPINVERLYYQLRGDGPIDGDLARQVRRLVADLAGRAL